MKHVRRSSHPAQLNIVGCAAFALARQRNLPLLFKGNDSTRTDVQPALVQGKPAAT